MLMTELAETFINTSVNTFKLKSRRSLILRDLRF